MAIHTTYTDARAKLAEFCNRATADRETVVISRRGGESVVLVAETELRGLEETAHLLRSPRNAQRLTAAIDRARKETVKPQTVESLREEMEIGKR